MAAGVALAWGRGAWGQTARPNVGAIDHDRMVAMGEAALARGGEAPLTATKEARSPGGAQDYFSDEKFLGHRQALRRMSVAVGALAGAYGVTREERFAAAAAAVLRVWFVDAGTRMTPNLNYARVVLEAGQPVSGTAEGLIEAVYLAEVAMAVPFVSASSALTDAELGGVKGWFGAYLKWLTAEEDSGARIAALARDLKNHHGSSWLLQAAAMARLTGNDAVLAECRRRFERITLRAQVSGGGSFPAELTTANPYRNSLLNLDLLAGVCEVLSSGFESVWDYELQDGPGMRGAMAYHVPFIERRAAWPYPADAAHFGDLPLRRPALVFAAKAYTRPEYADLWKRLPADPREAADGAIAEAFPIRQPYLWVTRARRRAVD